MARKRTEFATLQEEWSKLAETFNFVSISKSGKKDFWIKKLQEAGVHITQQWWTAYVNGGLIVNQGYSTFCLTFANWESLLSKAYKSYYPDSEEVTPKITYGKLLSEYSDDELLKELRRRHPGNEIMVANNTHYPVMVPYNEEVEIVTHRKTFRKK